jgi:galactokinase
MNTDLAASRLVDAGFGPDDAESRAQLLRVASAALRDVTKQPPQWAWFSPGRIEVFGKHTDYAGGRSLVAAVPRGFVLVATPRDDGRVRVVDARWHDTMEVDAADTTSHFRGWANYIAVVVRRLAYNFPGAALGADIAIASDLPRAAGVSSSSALVVAVATALIRRAGLAARPDFQSAIQSTLDLAGYLGAVENGLTFKALASVDGVGTHGGSEDHTAILTCRANCLSAYSYVPVRHLGDAAMPGNWSFVVASSGVHADKAGSAKDRYNRASLLTRALLDVWNAGTSAAAPTLAAALSASGAEDELRQLIARHGHADYGAGDLQQRLTHFVGEDGRIPQALDAFRDGDGARLGALSDATQRDADELLGNQIPETRVLASLARRHGAIAASSFGAGFGGSVWAVVPNADAPSFTDAWVAAYRKEYPQVANVESFITRPSRAVTELPL